MASTRYEVIEAGPPKAPVISLIKISGDRSLTASLKAFGPNYFNANIEEMSKQYSHPKTGEIISLREPTTAESILVAAYDFSNKAKPEIFDLRWLQAGRIVRTSDGVFANPPKDDKGNTITDEEKLKSFLNGVKPIQLGKGKIYIVSNANNLKDFGFAEYNSFIRGFQDAGDFIEGGLSRVLEHTEKSAENFKEIASKKNYPGGVDVWGFDSVNTPALKVAGLDSVRSLGDYGLNVDGDFWDDGNYGCAFGVLD